MHPHTQLSAGLEQIEAVTNTRGGVLGEPVGMHGRGRGGGADRDHSMTAMGNSFLEMKVRDVCWRVRDVC